MRTLPVGEQVALAAVTAILTLAITFFDLESTFGIAALPARPIRATAWWWGFLIVNGALSILMWVLLQAYPPFRSWNPWAYSFAIGLAYPALVRLKLTTITINDQKVSVGLERLYEGAKEYAYARINAAVKANRTAKAQRLIATKNLKTLARDVRFDIEFDSLVSFDEKVRRLEWLLGVMNATTIDDDEKKLILAIALISGSPPLRKVSANAAAARPKLLSIFLNQIWEMGHNW